MLGEDGDTRSPLQDCRVRDWQADLNSLTLIADMEPCFRDPVNKTHLLGPNIEVGEGWVMRGVEEGGE